MNIMSLFGFRDPAAKSFTEKVNDKLKRNVDWQHRIEALENEIKSKDKKIDQQRIELGEQDKKLAEARTAAADLLKSCSHLHENENKLRLASLYSLDLNARIDALSAIIEDQQRKAEEPKDSLRNAERELRSAKIDMKAMSGRVRLLESEACRLRGILQSIVDLAWPDVNASNLPGIEDDEDDESDEKSNEP